MDDGAAAVFPGQALLLANILDSVGSSDMVSRGNFFALMFFVMGIGAFLVYFIMGWGTNIIAQVSGLRGLSTNVALTGCC